MSKETDKEYIIRCECGDRTDHVVLIGQYDIGSEHGDDRLGQCLISLTLDVRKYWYQRVWAGLKYIFGRQNYMYMDTTVDVDKLREVVAQLQDYRTDNEKAHARTVHNPSVQVL